MTTYDELESLASEFAIECLGWTDIVADAGYINSGDYFMGFLEVESILEWAGGWCEANGYKMVTLIEGNFRTVWIIDGEIGVGSYFSTCLKKSIMRACLKAKEAMK